MYSTLVVLTGITVSFDIRFKIKGIFPKLFLMGSAAAH